MSTLQPLSPKPLAPLPPPQATAREADAAASDPDVVVLSGQKPAAPLIPSIPASAPATVSPKAAAVSAANPVTLTNDTTPISVTPAQLANLYNYPKEYDGSGQTIAIVAFEGSGFNDADLTQYFASQGIPKPDIRTVSVDGVQNTPGTNANTNEVATDVKVAGSMAPGARIVVYFTKPTPQGYADVMRTIMNDKENHPQTVSFSYAEGEQLWSQDPEFKDVDSTFQEAAAKGINIFASSGDNGNLGANQGEGPQVNFPASSPFVIAVGGTGVLGTAKGAPQEAAWNDKGNKWASGGGVSTVFKRPPWQSAISTPGGRAVPDVSADAAYVDLGGTFESGTSVSGPAWAALAARLNQGMNGQLGFLGPQLYQPGVRATFNDVTQGNNTMDGSPTPGFSAGPGWDAVTGLGTPNGEALLAALKEARGTAASAPRLRMVAQPQSGPSAH